MSAFELSCIGGLLVLYALGAFIIADTIYEHSGGGEVYLALFVGVLWPFAALVRFALVAWETAARFVARLRRSP